MLISEMIELMEASKYDAMFDRILGGKLEFAGNDTLKLMKENIEGEIHWARSFLKREDRIVWYLRLIKIYYTNILYQRYPRDENIDSTFPDDADNLAIAKEKAAIGRDLKKTEAKANTNARSITSLNTLKQELTHYLGQDIASIQNYTFSNESPQIVFDKLEDLESEWQSKIGTETVQIQDGDDLVMKFDGNMGWWLLDRGGCQDEADAMGHCGNVPSQKSGDRILSFRTQIEGNYWKPHLTFILDGNGYLGEMKGRSNDKPAEKYHPYIIALLKNEKLIKGIKGGGYMPQNNFSLDDLDESDREELIQMNPNLMSVFDKYKKDGLTPEVTAGLENKLYDSPLPGIDSIEQKETILETWDDLERLANDLDIEPLKNLISYVEQEDDIDDLNNKDNVQELADELDVPVDLYYDILEKMSTEQLKTIADDMELDADVTGFNGIFKIAENIDKTEYGDTIRRAIVKTQDFDHTSIKENPKLNDFIETVFQAIYRSSRNYHGSFEYDKNDIFETGIKYVMPTDYFVDVLRESFADGDDYDDEEAFMIAHDVQYNQSWTGMDSYEFSESLKQLSGKEKYSDFDQDDIDTYSEFSKIIDNTPSVKFNFDKLKPIDVAREATKMIQFNESVELERLNILAGIKK